MKISTLIDRLHEVQEKFGDIEVTCTATTFNDNSRLRDGVMIQRNDSSLADVWESTVETLVVIKPADDRNVIGTRVRLFL